jgi:hypothetical protein
MQVALPRELPAAPDHHAARQLAELERGWRGTKVLACTRHLDGRADQGADAGADVLVLGSDAGLAPGENGQHAYGEGLDG